MTDDSITLWLEQLKAGDRAAMQRIWDRYVEQLLVLARRKFGAAPRRVADEQDAVQSVFLSLCRGAEAGRFPKLYDRTDLWQVLLLLTRDKVAGQIRRNTRKKRGGGDVRGESALRSPDESKGGFDQILRTDPNVDSLVALEENFDRLMELLTGEQREVARMRLEGYSNEEIAARLDLSTRSVERKLQRVRSKWSEALTDPKTT